MQSMIYLARHATPDWSRVDVRYDIPPGPPLTAQGEAEAAQLGAFLREAGVRKIYASPLERALRTAQIAGEQAAIPVEEIAMIAEWQRGESEAAVLERFLPFWASACVESQSVGPLALVTHGGPVRLMLEYLEHDREEIKFYRKQFDRDNPLPPAGAWRIHREHEDGPWRIELCFTPQPFQRYEAQIVHV
jgi:broad specificity phosphatase PhoE